MPIVSNPTPNLSLLGHQAVASTPVHQYPNARTFQHQIERSGTRPETIRQLCQEAHGQVHFFEGVTCYVPCVGYKVPHIPKDFEPIAMLPCGGR